MPSYSKRKLKGGTIVYDVRFRIMGENGEEVQKRLSSFSTKKEAEKAYMNFMSTYVPPTTKKVDKRQYTYDSLIVLYKKKMEAQLAVSSYYDLCWILDKYITPGFSGKSIPDLKKADYSEWQTELWAAINPKNGKPYTQKYLTKIRAIMTAFLSFCEETYDIPNVLKSLKRPVRKEMKHEMQIWEPDEFKQFIEAVDDITWKTFFMLLFYSGCRVGEVLALSDHDLVKSGQNYTINISKGVTRKTGNSEMPYLVTAPKTNTSNRSVLLPDIMTEQIDTYLQYKHENKIASSFFFGGNHPIPQRNYQHAFERYIKASGVKRIRIHDLRHSHASLLIHLNVPITVISKRLGHSTVKMTLERYSHCYSDGDSVAIQALNSLHL